MCGGRGGEGDTGEGGAGPRPADVSRDREGTGDSECVCGGGGAEEGGAGPSPADINRDREGTEDSVCVWGGGGGGRRQNVYPELLYSVIIFFKHRETKQFALRAVLHAGLCLLPQIL